MITNQELVRRVIDHFIVQENHPGWSPPGECRYETPEGHCCAIGIFLPPGHPARLFLGSLYMLVERFPDIGGIFEDLEFANAIQGAHDSAAQLSSGPSGIRLDEFRRRLLWRINMECESFEIEYDHK